MRAAMADTAQFTIGTGVSCSDGPAGRVSRVIVDPVAEKVTHLVVEPGYRGDLGRLVPLDLVDGTAGEIRLACTRAEFERLERALETGSCRRPAAMTATATAGTRWATGPTTAWAAGRARQASVAAAG